MFSLGPYTFSDDETQWFASASGDYNPIHIDAVSARRLISGKQVVHGMHTIIAALNSYYKNNKHIPNRIQAYFSKPIFVGDKVDFHFEVINEEPRIFVQDANEEVASIRLIGSGCKLSSVFFNSRPESHHPKNFSFDDLKDLCGRIELMLDNNDINSYFPNVANRFGNYPIAVFMAFSRIIGMEAPGLNSLFTGLDVKFSKIKEMSLSWEVSRHGSSFSPIQVQVKSEGVNAALEAFVRPEPVAQASMKDIKIFLEKNLLIDQRALVIGGSRGLGEVVSKCVAAGGGKVLATYSKGENEAIDIRREINDNGGFCEIVKLDVNELQGFKHIIDTFKPTHVYYFASGRITKSLSNYNEDHLKKYLSIYVDAFSAIAHLIAKNTEHPIRMFYPSTIFIDEVPNGFDEYIKAKIAGEKECQKLEREFSKMNILIKRLPMLQTDQTTSLIPSAAKPALPEILKIIDEMRRI